MTEEAAALDVSTDDADQAAFVADVLPSLTELDPKHDEYKAASLALRERFSNGSTRTSKARAAAIVAMRLGGMKSREIGKVLGIKPDMVRMVLYRARKNGTCTDIRVLLENDSAALALESLNTHLRKKDKDVTLETMKGLGYFKHYSNNKNEGGAAFTMPALQVNVVLQHGGPAPLPGQAHDFSEAAVGTPRVDDAEIVDAL